jgi:VIT1/CCC1 family predicted Fe2+/Mn2+ transporter
MHDHPPTQHTHPKRFERAQSGTARAALLGISDGLVTNVSLILGVAAAGANPGLVRIAGLASLIAGACSMAVGEYISMRGQAELLESVLATERAQLHDDPDAIHAIIEDGLIADGVNRQTAHNAGREIARNPDKAIAVYARVHLGINTDQLGSAWGSAGSSLLMFSLGAAVPLLPWFIGSGTAAIATSLLLAAAAALGIGTYLGATTNGHWLRSALRQLLVLILAAGVTYLIGRLFHTSIS